MLVRSRMTREVISASPDTTLARALEITRAHAIRHLPVVDEAGSLVGIVSNRDLRLAHPPIYLADHEDLREALNAHALREIMVREVISVSADATVEEAARLLCAHHIGCLPVLDGGALVGIITETDLLTALAEMIGASGTASRVEVKLPNRPGELARVVRLIGVDMRINITGLFSPPAEDGHCRLVVHLQTSEPRAVVNALRGLGYETGSPAIELDPIPQEPYVARMMSPAMRI